MALWCLFGVAYNENYSAEVDGFLHRMDELGLWGMGESTNLNEARAHGNPYLDVTSLIRQESTAVMGQQMETYDSEDQAQSASDEAASGNRYQEMFELLPEIWNQNHSFHIIDADDPELLEHGEAYIHEKLTSYVAEPFREGSELPLPPYVRRYVGRNTVDGLATPWYAGLPAVFLEPLRQRLGFPDEWWGAPID
jgi:hypothetical protein